MEGEKFSSFALSYLKKRPRLSPTRCLLDDAVPSTSYATETTSSGSNVRRILIEPSDEQLLSWQEQQISKCIVDNTVNRVVESYLTFFEEENVNADGTNGFNEHINSYHSYRDQQNFEESYAILRAIDEFGLQQNNEINDIMSTSSSSISISSPVPSPSNFSFHNDAGTISNENNQLESNSALINAQSIDLNMTGNAAAENKEIRESAVFHINESESAINDYADTLIDNEHYEFIETAVSVAIQEKGLAPYSMQLSPKR